MVSRAVRRAAPLAAIAGVAILATCDLGKLVGTDSTKAGVGTDSSDLNLTGDTLITLGGTLQLALSSAADLKSTVTRWSSSDSSVIAIGVTTGLATGVNVGTARITARVLSPELGEGVTTSRAIRVRYKGIRITAPTASDSIEGLGQTRTINLFGLNNAGLPVGASLTQLDSLKSRDTTVFQVAAGAPGFYITVARKNGVARLVAAVDGLRDSVLVRVRQVAKSITFPTAEYTGRHVNFNVTVPVSVLDVANQPISAPALTWRINDTTVATIGVASGVLKLKKVDTTTVFVRVDSVERGQKLVVAQVAASLSKSSGDTSGTVAKALSVPPTATVRDSGGTPVANVSVTFKMASGGGKITDSVKTTDASGKATLGSWTLGDIAGSNSLVVTAGGQALTITAKAVAGLPVKVGFLVHPASTPVDSVIKPSLKVAIQDPLGNTVTTSTDSVRLTFANSIVGAVLGGTTTVAAVSGIATFASLAINKGGVGYTLKASSGELSEAISNAFDVVSAATRLGFSVQPRDVTVGTPMGSAVKVAIQDASGSTVTSATDSVTLTLSPNPSAANLGGTTRVAAVGGVATFTGLTLDKVATGYKLMAKSAGLDSAFSNSFGAVPVTAAKRLAFSVQPSNVVAGALISPVVQVVVQDSAGATVISSDTTITLSIDPAANPGGSTIGGTTTVKALNGIASFGTITLNKSGVGYMLRASSTSLASATSGAFNVTPGTASRLGFVQNPTHSVAGATLAPPVAVAIQDLNRNTVTTAPLTNVALTLRNCMATLNGATTASTLNGVATFSNLSIATQVSNCGLGASATGFGQDTSTTFNIVPNTGAVKLGFTASPVLNTTAGSSFGTITVALQDVNGATVTSAPASTITLSLASNPGNGTLTGTLTANTANAVATFTGIGLTTAANGYTLSATAGAFQSAISGAFNITPGAPTKMAWVQQPATTTAGVAFSPAIAVAVHDAFGNTVTSVADTIVVMLSPAGASGTLVGSTRAPLVNGVATFTDLRIRKSNAGYLLDANKVISPVAGIRSAAFNVDKAPAQLGFAAQPNASYASMSPISVAVQAHDSVGNAYTDMTEAITLSLTGGSSGATLGGIKTATLASGTASFANITVDKAGSLYRLNASASGFATSTSIPFDVTPGAPARLVFIGQPVGACVGSSLPPITVAVQDISGNTVLGSNATVTVAVMANPGAAAAMSGTTSAVVVNGMATFSNLSFSAITSGVQLTATSGSLTSSASVSFGTTDCAGIQAALQDPFVEVLLTAVGGTVEAKLRQSINQALGAMSSYNGAQIRQALTAASADASVDPNAAERELLAVLTIIFDYALQLAGSS